jgi:hypothetical protein
MSSAWCKRVLYIVVAAMISRICLYSVPSLLGSSLGYIYQLSHIAMLKCGKE